MGHTKHIQRGRVIRMRIIETCPVCGGDLQSIMIATYPPIPEKRCYKCGWHWEGEQDEVVRVPFIPPTPAQDTTPACCRNCPNHPDNGGSGICSCALPYMTYTGKDVTYGTDVVSTVSQITINE